MKERFTITSSSLGNYFGVGFEPPMTQLEYDLGEKERVITEADEARMKLGINLEKGMLDYFESVLGISIINRNEKTEECFDGFLRIKIDGETIYQGEPTIVECKVSSTDFTQNLGYMLQVQAYMHAKGYKQALLCGLSAGSPKYTLIRYNEDIAKDIEEMVYAVRDILNGIADKEDFPWHLVDKYANTDDSKELVEADLNDDILYVQELKEIKDKIKVLESREKELENYIKYNYTNTYANLSDFTFKCSTMERKGSYDMDLLMANHPEIDFESYRKPSSTSTVIRFSKAKK